MYKYIFSFIVYLVLVISYLLSQYNSKLLIQEQNLGNSAIRSFDAVHNSFELLNDSYHNQNESKMAYIIKDVSEASLITRDKIRYKLREEFTAFCNDRKLANLKTFHIFDKNGASILRFHKLEKYDDSLLSIRESLMKMSNSLKFQEGFEVGKYTTTYRFQYPLFYDGEFVGSYEFGIEFDAIDKEMQKIFGIKNVLFIQEENIRNIYDKKILKDLYRKIEINHKTFYMLKTKMNSEISNRFKELINVKKTVKTSNNKTTFTRFSYAKKDYIAIATPITDINGKYLGFILTGVEDTMLEVILRTFIEELIFSLLFGLLFIYLVYRELEYRKYIRNIIDTQHDILIVTNDKKIIDANQAFLDFFGFKNIKSFLKNANECICDYFLKEDGYIQKNMNGLNWIEHVNTHLEELNVAILKDINQENRYLKIEIEPFEKSDNFVILFKDVTDELQKQQELENKAYYDKLTNIYSRERFDYFLDKKLNQKREFSLIMFDIDHFKLVNDKYGHDAGDSVLKELTKLVSEHIREDDVFARWGGEEFMVIVNTDISKAEKFANKLRAVIDNYKFKYVEDVTCSFGVVGYKSFDKLDTIVKRADNMLYTAKNSGRNCVVVLN